MYTVWLTAECNAFVDAAVICLDSTQVKLPQSLAFLRESFIRLIRRWISRMSRTTQQDSRLPVSRPFFDSIRQQIVHDL